jgi:hypothetical protein
VNQVLDAAWSETLHRLALGIEPADPLRASRIGFPVEVAVEGGRTIGRRDSCRHALLFRPGLAGPLPLRFSDWARRYVPRRLNVALAAPPEAGRIVRPALFPGAAYDVPAGAMGIRGTITRGGAPMRWARAEARRTTDGAVVGRAHGDDRGEFVLLVSADAVVGAELLLPVRVRVRVFGPDAAPVPPPAAADDALWDLPLEEAPLAGADAVLAGEALPPGYATRPNAEREVELGLDGLGSEAFDFS